MQLNFHVTAKAAILAALMVITPHGARGDETGPSGLTCHFEEGHTWSYDKGKFQEAAPSPLSFAIEAIDLEKQSAKLIVDGTHAGTLRVVRALNANSFLEVAQEGFLNLTTIYDKDPATGTYPAVHSRHFGVLGQPIFAQYAGTCSAR